MNITFEIKEELGQIGASKQLSIVSWNGNPAKYDLRTWHATEDGEPKPGKGLTMSEDEARELLAVLKAHFKE